MLRTKLINLRKAKKWTQTDLAERCGVSRNSIVNWETGKSSPKIGDIQTLAKIFNISPNDLINDDNIPTAKTQTAIHEEKSNEPENFAYWGRVLDNTRKVAERGDLEEIDLITPLLKSALHMLLSVRERFASETIEDTTRVSAYNGDNSTYNGNILNFSKAIA